MSTQKQKSALKKIVENHGNVSKGMVDVGYSKNTAKNPKNLTKSKGWKELVENILSDTVLIETHKKLLEATGIDHMVFPLGIKDEQIIALLNEANCIAKRFMHAETVTHVWYFHPDNKARNSALDLAYKIRGKIKEGNTFVQNIQNNNITLTPEQRAELNSISSEGEEYNLNK